MTKKVRTPITVAVILRRSEEYSLWREKILRQYDNRCWVSGRLSKKLHVHHANKGFYHILSEIMHFMVIPYDAPVRKISKNKLESIKRVFWLKHKSAKGVPMLPSLHREFHKRYGVTGTTMGQLEDFKKDFLNRKK